MRLIVQLESGRAADGLFRWLRSLLLGLLLVVNVGVAGETVSREYQIKAAYLYNFAKFINWPEQRFASTNAPLVIGILGANPFGQELETIAASHQINGRNILIKPLATPADAASVHLLFFTAAETDEVAKLRGHAYGVVTVGESEQFIAAGGVIAFVREADKVRFEINPAAAEEQGVKISAQLLKLARLATK